MNHICNKIDRDFFYISPHLDKDNTSYTYGEVCFKNIAKIIEELHLNDRSILDVGSGCGKIIIYLACKFNTYVDGIEIEINRFDQSYQLLDKLDLHQFVSLYNCDFEDIYFGNYDIIYCCNLVFSKEDNNRLFTKILKELKGYAFLFFYDYQLKGYLKKSFTVTTSWNKNEIIYFFEIC